MLNSSVLLSKSQSWQTLHANSNALDKEGNLAPTLYTCNLAANKYDLKKFLSPFLRFLFIQFFTDGSLPKILLRANVTNEPLLDIYKNPEKFGNFTPIDYAELPGSNFIFKLDAIFNDHKT